MKNWRWFTVIVLLLASPPPANAAEASVQQMRKMCISAQAWERGEMDRLSDVEKADALSCIYFIQGISGVMTMNKAFNDTGQPAPLRLRICNPPSDAAAMIQAFVLWTDQNPSKWVLPPIIGVIEALRAQWPCPE